MNWPGEKHWLASSSFTDQWKIVTSARVNSLNSLSGWNPAERRLRLRHLHCWPRRKLRLLSDFCSSPHSCLPSLASELVMSLVKYRRLLLALLLAAVAVVAVRTQTMSSSSQSTQACLNPRSSSPTTGQPRNNDTSQPGSTSECPGMDDTLFGYDSLKGNPLGSGFDPGFTLPIFSADCSSCHVPSACRVPRGVVVSPDVSCVTSFQSEVVETPYHLTKLLTLTARLTGGGWGPPFSANDDFRQLSADLGHNVLVVSTAACRTHRAKLQSMGSPPFDPHFIKWIRRLNASNSDDVFNDFLSTYGTHFVSGVTFGASTSFVYKLDAASYKRLIPSESDLATACSIMSSLNTDHKPQGVKSDESPCRHAVSVPVIKGVPLSGSRESWLAEIRKNPVPLTYDLTSVEALFSDVFMGHAQTLGDDAIDYVRLRDGIARAKARYSKILIERRVESKSDFPSPGLTLNLTQLSPLSKSKFNGPAATCAAQCHLVTGCVAVSTCQSCTESDVNYLACYTFHADVSTTAVQDDNWLTTIVTSKLRAPFIVFNTTSTDSSLSAILRSSVTTARACYTLCLANDFCAAFTFSLGGPSGERCTLHSDMLQSLKRYPGTNMHILPSTARSLLRKGAREGYHLSSMPSDWAILSCDSNDDCQEFNTECFMGRCVCKPEFFFSPADRICHSACSMSDLLDTFMEYPDSGIQGRNLTSANGISLQECVDLCIKTNGCLSFDFRDKGGRCQTHDVTAGQVPQLWYSQTSRGWTHYHRACQESVMLYPGQAMSDSCLDIQKGGSTSGHYSIFTSSGSTLDVWCDMDSGGGGWLVFQRRRDGSVNFYRDWREYESGFGDVTGEFWLGLSRVHQLTASRPRRLRVDFGDVNGHRHYAEYSSFRVDGPETNYTLTVSGYSGTAGDSLSVYNNTSFSTSDRRNDKSIHTCSYDGAWWSSGCLLTNLNGRYQSDGGASRDGINWRSVHGNNSNSFTFVEMKLQ